jgi:NMD protein affecting ribosome stability and mRNA decay
MTKDTDITTQGRRDRLIKEQVHDPYMTRRKPPEPTVCPECGVVFQQGRWQWSAAVRGGTHEELCPACQRIRDKVPAGILSLSGAFLEDHQEEIINLVRNKVDSEKAQHPMKRLMNIEPHAGGMVITFTDTHLPRGVGEAIQRAYEGELEIQYTEEAGIVRVNWSR